MNVHTQQELRWFELWGSYASALVAAPTYERALEIAKHSTGYSHWQIAPDREADHQPGPPTVEGLYHWYAE